MRPIGRPSRPEGRFWRTEEEGKTVERVPRGVKWSIRRAWMADSREVGILRAPGQEGFEKICCGRLGKLLARRGRRRVGRRFVICMVGEKGMCLKRSDGLDKNKRV
jgi:hypothetical protein